MDCLRLDTLAPTFGLFLHNLNLSKMKKVDQIRLAMWRAVELHLGANNSLWNANGPFAEAAAELSQAIRDAWGAAEKQVGGSKGVSSRRDAMEQEALDRVVIIARVAKAFALNTDNHELLHAERLGKGSLEIKSQAVLIATLRSMVNAAKPYKDALVRYGVPADAYEAALEAINALEGTQTAVRTAISGRKAVTDSVYFIMKAGALALAKLDNLVHVFELQYPEFVAGYKAARTIIHTGIRHKDDESTEAA
jgi:hypothetical protein